MNHRVQAYIDRINADDPTLREINLASLNLGDTYITELMAALTSNPNVAQRIVTLNLADNKLTSINIPETLVALQKLNLSDNQSTSINIPATLVALQKLSLYGNQLTSINIPEALMALRWLNIEDNPLLTVATKIALETLRRTLVNNNFLMFYENPVSAATQLTDDILNAHFKLMLRSHPEQIIAHLKKTSAVWLLSYLPYELAGKIGEYVESIAEVERALASMTNFQSIFNRLFRLNVDNNEQLNTLNRYNKTVLQELIKKTKNYYANAFQSKTIVKLGLRLNKFNNQAEEVTPKAGIFSYMLYPIIFIFKDFKFVAVTISNVMSKLIYGKSNSHVEKESKIAQAPLPGPALENTKSCLQAFNSMLPCFTLARKRNNTHGSLLPSLTRSTPLHRPHSSSM